MTKGHEKACNGRAVNTKNQLAQQGCQNSLAKVGQNAYRKLLNAALASGSDLLIGGYKGNKDYRNFAKREFKELVQEVGEKFSPYDCRHTFATQAQRSGVDPQTLRRMLGHASVSTTDKYYTHLDTDDILQEAALIKVV